MMMRYLLLVLFSLCSCTSIRYIPSEYSSRDSVFYSTGRIDSIRVRDSIVLQRMIVSDTIREIKHVYHETTKFELRSDTVYIHKTDSIRIPAPVSKDVDDDYITDTLTVIVMVLLAGYIFVDRFKR